MKTIKIRSLLSACLLAVIPASAQVTNSPPPPNPNSLPSTIIGYFSSFNTNMATFTGTTFDLWSGASSVQGGHVPLVNDIGFSYDFWRPVPANTNSPVLTAFDAEATIRNSGVAGTVEAAQGGVGFSIIIYDTKLTFYGNGGYNLDKEEMDKWYGEVGLRAKKGVGDHFYLGVGMGAQFPNVRQVFSAFAGATF